MGVEAEAEVMGVEAEVMVEEVMVEEVMVEEVMVEEVMVEEVIATALTVGQVEAGLGIITIMNHAMYTPNVTGG